MGYTVGSGNLIYRGAFTVPNTTMGSPGHFYGLAYGGQALGYNPYRGPSGSLFIVGHHDENRIAEISIVAPRTGSVGSLNQSSALQNLSSVQSRVPFYNLDNDASHLIGGILVTENSGIIFTVYEFYDGDADGSHSHYTMQTLNLATGTVAGLYDVGPNNAGFYAGYMGHIPAANSGTVRKKYITGLCGVAVVSRTSAGPALFGFDESDFISTGVQGSVNTLVSYPYPQGGSGPDDHPIWPMDSTSVIFNTSAQIRGVVWPSGSDTVLFFGSLGTGTWWYGSNGDFSGLNDPARTSQGVHAYPYIHQVWAYPVSGLMRVLSGQINSWEAPYTYWKLSLPYTNESAFAGGVAYDPTRNRVYLSQLEVDPQGFDYLPVIHVFDISGSPSTGGNPPTDHLAEFTSTTRTNLYVDASVTSLSVPLFRGISSYGISGLLNHMFRASSLTKPNLWLALLSSAPQADDTVATISEIAHGAGYSRLNVTGNGYWSVPIQSNESGGLYNTSPFTFSAAQANWGWISGWAILDSSGDGAGNILFMGSPTAKYVTAGDILKFPTGSLQINIG